MRFVDLFSGIGGFHEGLRRVGDFECVFASEINEELRKLYDKNFGIYPSGDIRSISEKNIPKHDILCAGFPCQPFSLAGKKQGYKCPESGDLIKDILRITKHHLPNFLILENVPNILKIENGKFWKYIQKSFNKIGYKIIYKIISPLDVGIPQNRDRIFILGFRNANHLNKFRWPNKNDKVKPLTHILTSSKEDKFLSKEKFTQIQHWQKLLDTYNETEGLSSISIVAPEMGANYPLDFSNCTLNEMSRYKGAYGLKIKKHSSWEKLLLQLPSYVRKERKVPEWLKKSTIQTRELYKKNKSFLDVWKKDINKTNNSWQILEWRGKKKDLELSNHILQFRASGIRVLKRDKIPSLIAMTPTQRPIIGSEMRYISKIEAAKLQNLHQLKYLPENDSKAFRYFGNAVNSKIVELIANNIIKASS